MKMGLTDNVWTVGELMFFVIDKISTKIYHITAISIIYFFIRINGFRQYFTTCPK